MNLSNDSLKTPPVLDFYIPFLHFSIQSKKVQLCHTTTPCT